MAAHQVRMHNSEGGHREAAGSAATPVVEGCKGMRFGPYALNFPGLQQLLRAAWPTGRQPEMGGTWLDSWVDQIKRPSPNW